MYILHQNASQYTLTSESQKIVLSLNTNDDTPDDTPDAHTIRFWNLGRNSNETKIGYQKSDEKGAIKAFREILSVAKDNLANLSDFKVSEPKSRAKPKTDAPTTEVPKSEPTTE